jgi:hypothetical protein
MATPRRPAAYLGVSTADGEQAVIHAARQRDWPAPKVYADSEESLQAGGAGLALDRLDAAVTAGRHDGLLLTPPGNPSALMQLLMHCTQHGVTVGFVHVLAAEDNQVVTAATASTRPLPLLPTSGEHWDILAQARLEALDGLFPDWRIWLDRHGWHARRRGAGYLQGYRAGAPAFCVHARTAVDLAAQLCWQRGADDHAPDGCQASILPPPPWGQAADGAFR